MKNRIQQSFNKAAFTYDQAADLQIKVGLELIKMIKKYEQSFASIADLGCGSGKTTEYFVQNFAYDKFQASDFSVDLLNIARKRLAPYDVDCFLADFDDGLQQKYELIYSNMALQWSENIEKLFINMHQNCKNIFAFTLPLTGSLIELTPCSRNEFYSENQVNAYLQKAGFKILESKSQLIINNYFSKLEALRSLKAVGANQLLSPISQSKLCRIKLHQQSSLTYNIGFFIAVK